MEWHLALYDGRKMLFLLSVFRPVGYDHAKWITPEVMAEIDRLNDEMVAAGVRVFVGGLQPPSTAISVIQTGEGSHEVATGSAKEADRFLDGLWVIDVATVNEAQEWAQKASAACRADTEVRPFY